MSAQQRGKTIGVMPRRFLCGVVVWLCGSAHALGLELDLPSPMFLSPGIWSEAAVGQPYRQVLRVEGGAAPYQWSQSGLPQECALIAGSAATAEIACDALDGTHAGARPVTIRVEDAAAALIEPRQFVVSWLASAPSVADQSLPPGAQGVVYEHFLTAVDGQAPRTWRLASGTLPQGVALYEDGLIYGTPTESGEFAITVRVADAAQAEGSRVLLLTVKAVPIPPLSIELPGAPLALQGRTPVEQRLTAHGGDGDYLWELAAGQEHLGLSLLGNGVLVGAPRAVGEHVLQVRVSDGGGRVASAGIPIRVSAQGLTYALPGHYTHFFAEGEQVEWPFPVEGGQAPYVIALAGGQLPPGLRLDQGVAGLSGVPQRQGEFEAVLGITDGQGERLERTLTFVVAEAYEGDPEEPDGGKFSVRLTTSGPGTVAFSPAGEAGETLGNTRTVEYAQGESVTLTAQASVGASFIGWSGACTGSVPSCTLRMEDNRAVVAAFAGAGSPENGGVPMDGAGTPTVSAAGSGGTITAQASGGWVFTRAAVLPAPAQGSAGLPAGATLPHGLLDFELALGPVGTPATVMLSYPGTLPQGARVAYYKYGRTQANPTPHWYVFGGAQVNTANNTVTLTLQDGGAGDDDLAANGAIRDPGGLALLPAGAGAVAIPTLGEWALALLAGALGLFSLGALRRRG